MKISIFYTLFLALVISGCKDSSNDEPSHELIGNWISNCHQNSSGNFSTKKLIITESNYDIDQSVFSDSNCTLKTNTSYFINDRYYFGEEVIADDGLPAKSVFRSREGWSAAYGEIYRITNNELVFGEYASSNTSSVSSLDYSIIYTRM